MAAAATGFENPFSRDSLLKKVDTPSGEQKPWLLAMIRGAAEFLPSRSQSSENREKLRVLDGQESALFFKGNRILSKCTGILGHGD